MDHRVHTRFLCYAVVPPRWSYTFLYYMRPLYNGRRSAEVVLGVRRVYSLTSTSWLNTLEKCYFILCSLSEDRTVRSTARTKHGLHTRSVMVTLCNAYDESVIVSAHTSTPIECSIAGFGRKQVHYAHHVDWSQDINRKARHMLYDNSVV
jgi:hypothetical protein